jgi:hypothetical protein
MLLYKMVLCLGWFMGTCDVTFQGDPVSQQRCYQDIAQVRNLRPTDHAWCSAVWVAHARDDHQKKTTRNGR